MSAAAYPARWHFPTPANLVLGDTAGYRGTLLLTGANPSYITDRGATGYYGSYPWRRDRR